MVKHTQTILRQQPMNFLSVFNYFAGLALTGLSLPDWEEDTLYKMSILTVVKDFSLCR